MTSSPAFLQFARPDIDEATIAGVAEVLRSGWITTGPKVAEFENALSAYFGGRPVRAFNSGTCTMEIALRIAGVGPGDAVITTPISWVATSNVVIEVGAQPVFVDIDPVTRNIDLGRLEEAITSQTRAAIPVGIAGLPVDRDRLYDIAARHQLRIVEDAAQAFGSLWNGRRIGSIGDLVSFSFHANKNLTTAEGGCLVLNDEHEAQLAERYRLQGVVRSGIDGMDVEFAGGKFNLTDIAACIGLGQLARLPDLTRRRHALARHYFRCLGDAGAAALGLQLPVADFETSNWHMFQVLLPEERLTVPRAGVMAALKERGIGTGVHCPAIHLFTLYRTMGWRAGDFPHAEYAGRNLLTVPLFATLTESDVERVVANLVDVVQGFQRS